MAMVQIFANLQEIVKELDISGLLICISFSLLSSLLFACFLPDHSEILQLLQSTDQETIIQLS